MPLKTTMGPPASSRTSRSTGHQSTHNGGDACGDGKTYAGRPTSREDELNWIESNTDLTTRCAENISRRWLDCAACVQRYPPVDLLEV